jgi:hypothetical protein
MRRALGILLIIIGCKRILFPDDYYAALQLGHVPLEPTPLTRIADGSGNVGDCGNRPCAPT